MLTAKPQLNLKNAREYFREHLSTGDYYAQGQKVAGHWFGQGAEMLGLRGAVKEADFLAHCEGLNPTTNKKLTMRQNSRRHEDGKSVANRRVFYDFTLSPPKSVSVVALMQDERICRIHADAVRQALLELEKRAEARVRKSGQQGERPTGNILAATFRHDTSRELDPHLHTHGVVFNATFDPVEQRWKALEVQGMYRAQRFVENFYYHELAKGLRSLGYAIENTGRDFEIKGVPASVVSRFSKRRDQIDAVARERIEREGGRGEIKAIRRQVAEDSRRRKRKDSTADRLLGAWRDQLSPDERSALAKLQPKAVTVRPKADVAAVVAWADEFLFERRSVVSDHELMAAALARGRGEDFGLPALQAAIEARGYLRETGTQRLTSREVLRNELQIVVAAHDGWRRHPALNADFRPSPALSGEQKAAVKHILGSRDFITLFRGGAGTGKSFALKEVERGLRLAGRPVVVLAPQRQQVSDLQADGLPAETLARFLTTKQLPPGAVVLVDETGQVGGRQLRELVVLVKAGGGRLILSGDTRQYGAVAASDALSAIEKHAGLKPAFLHRIRRQDPRLGKSAKERAFIRRYRAAVEAAGRGDTADSFQRLDSLGCVRECGNDERRIALTNEYLAALARQERPLIVAQTRDEVLAVNESVRAKLRTAGKIGTGKTLTTYRPVDLGDAQKRDPRFYSPGQHAYFLRTYGRFAQGDLCEITGTTAHGLELVKDGRRSRMSYRYAERIAVAVASPMEVAWGDRLQLKFNGRSVEGAALANGELVTVRKVRRDGALVVASEGGRTKTLAPRQRLFVRGYAVTAYGSQGKTVDTVIFADAANRTATSANQWYVTISRGRKRVVVFTPDKEELREAVQQTGNRELALDLNTKVAPTLRTAGWQKQALIAVDQYRGYEAAVERARHQDVRQRIAI